MKANKVKRLFKSKPKKKSIGRSTSRRQGPPKKRVQAFVRRIRQEIEKLSTYESLFRLSHDEYYEKLDIIDGLNDQLNRTPTSNPVQKLELGAQIASLTLGIYDLKLLDEQRYDTFYKQQKKVYNFKAALKFLLGREIIYSKHKKIKYGAGPLTFNITDLAPYKKVKILI